MPDSRLQVAGGFTSTQINRPTCGDGDGRASENQFPCQFPFTYGGTVHTECTTAGHDQPWCYTNIARTAWGNCCDDPQRGIWVEDDGMQFTGQDFITVTGANQNNLPTSNITLEAWVQIGHSVRWGAIAGYIQDNGAFERGFQLVYEYNRVGFAVATERTESLVYM